ncbi:MAG: hypothetical protein ACKPKO_63530, partial [Candidatus Fonsibacter sp.]
PSSASSGWREEALNVARKMCIHGQEHFFKEDVQQRGNIRFSPKQARCIEPETISRPNNRTSLPFKVDEQLQPRHANLKTTGVLFDRPTLAERGSLGCEDSNPRATP